jgi:ABC-type sugar transport system substrate-binding protein
MKKMIVCIISLLFLLLPVMTACSGAATQSAPESSQAPAGDPNNDDLVGEGLGEDFKLAPIGVDLDTLMKRMGDKVKNIKLGVNVCHLSQNWQIMWVEEFERLSKHYGFKLLVLSSDDDPLKDAENIKSFVAQQCDAVCFYPQNIVAAIPALSAEINNIPIILLATAGDYFGEAVKVKNDQKSKGTEMAKMIAEDAKGEERNILLISIAGDLQYILDRNEGFKEVCDQNPNLNLVALIETTTLDDALNKAKEALLVHEDVNTIAGIASNPMLGGYNAALQLGRSEGMYVYAIDADHAILDLMVAGKVHGLVIQMPQMSAHYLTFMAFRYLNGDKFDSIQWIPRMVDFICRADQAEQARKVLYGLE